MQELIIDSDVVEARTCAISPLHVSILGRFRVERAGVPLPDSAWQQRRAARTLIKILATNPSHAVHREHLLELMWRDTEIKSALNSFAKALHAARRALQSEPRVGHFVYLDFHDNVLSLDAQHVVIDADRFQHLAETALQQDTVTGYELALAAYGGDLLPEDRYADWSAERRHVLSELRCQLLIGLAAQLERRGECEDAVDRLQAVLQEDPTREDVYRQLMRIHAGMGRRADAVRQYEICRRMLRQELDLQPDSETRLLYQDVVANRIEMRSPVSERSRSRVAGHEHFARQTAEVYGKLVDRLDRFGERRDGAAARLTLAIALISLAKFDRAVDVLRQARDEYMAIDDQQGMARVASQIELVRLLQDEWGKPARRPKVARHLNAVRPVALRSERRGSRRHERHAER